MLENFCVFDAAQIRLASRRLELQGTEGLARKCLMLQTHYRLPRRGRWPRGQGRAVCRTARCGRSGGLAAAHSAAGADEIVLLDITATHEKRATLLETVRRTARAAVYSVYRRRGNSDARRCEARYSMRARTRSASTPRRLPIPDLITADRRALRIAGGDGGDRCQARERWRALKSSSHGGTEADRPRRGGMGTEAEQRGAGEILLTSMDRDGTGDRISIAS